MRLLFAELSCGIILKEYWGKSEDVIQKEKTFIFGAILPEEIDEDDGKDHEDGDDKEEDLAPLLSLALEDDGIETALLGRAWRCPCDDGGGDGDVVVQT